MEDHEVPLLEEAIGKLWDKAREFGLDPFPVHFQMVPAHIMYEFGAYLLPGRFQHWSHGKAWYSDGDSQKGSITSLAISGPLATALRKVI